MNYLNALKRPFTNWKNFGIGALLSIIPIVNILTLGYIYRIIALTLKKDYSMPGWADKTELLVNGLLIILIFIIFMIPLAIVGFFGISPILTNPTGIERFNALAMMTIIQLLVIGLIGYLIPVLIINFVQQKKFLAIFQFSKLKTVFTLKYLNSWLVATLIIVVVSFIASRLGKLLLVEFIFVPVSSFITMIMLFTILTETVKQS